VIGATGTVGTVKVGAPHRPHPLQCARPPRVGPDASVTTARAGPWRRMTAGQRSALRRAQTGGTTEAATTRSRSLLRERRSAKDRAIVSCVGRALAVRWSFVGRACCALRDRSVAPID
jgi:hypothetical protein